MQQSNFKIPFNGTDYNTWYVRDASFAVDVLASFAEKDRQPYALDLETYGHYEYRNDPSAPLDPLRSNPRLIQLFDGFNVIIFDLLHIGNVSFLHKFLSDSRFVAHNAMFEIQHLLHNFKVLEPDCGCTKIATRLIYDAIYPNSAAYKADLEAVVKALLKVDLPKNIDHRCWGEPELNYEQLCYAANDVIVMPPIISKLSGGIKKYGLEKVYRLYKEAQVPLAKMQLNGIKMNQDKHRELISKWKLDAHAAKKDVLAQTGLDNTNPKSMIAYLEGTLPDDVLAIWPLTEGGEGEKAGELSLSADTFSDFSYLPIVEPFSRLKKATKLASTYGQRLLNRVNPSSKRIHCSYNLCGTRTGRLSSSNPNLQQLPRDNATRALFEAPFQRKFVVADFNQIELRVAAELSRDFEMLMAYKNGRDLHAVTAEAMARMSLSDMEPEEAKKSRQAAKALNFGLLFGLGKKKFKHYAHKNYGTEMTEEEALESVSAWRELYSGYTDWHRNIAQQCKETLRIRTVSGKLRALNEENYFGASANTPVQGSASEAMLHSLIRLNKKLEPQDMLVNIVHDEIMVETEDTIEDGERVKKHLVDCMCTGFRDIFPQGIVTDKLVEVKSGFNWAQCK